MPERETIKRAREDAREGKAPTTQAGEFVREEIHHVREGKHGARSPEQAIAIGLAKARRAGVKLPPPPKGKAKEKTRQGAKRALKRARKAGARHPSATGSEDSTTTIRQRYPECLFRAELQHFRSAGTKSQATNRAAAK